MVVNLKECTNSWDSINYVKNVEELKMDHTMINLLHESLFAFTTKDYGMLLHESQALSNAKGGKDPFHVIDLFSKY